MGIPYEVASYLDKNEKLMRKIFTTDAKEEDVKSFLEGWESVLKENKLDKRFGELIENNLVCFGPKKYGPNLMISRTIKKEDSLFYRLRLRAQGVKE